MLERVLGSSTDPTTLRQERAQPAGRNVDPGLLLQIHRQPLGRPDVKGEPERAGRGLQSRLQSRQVGGIRLHRSARARRIGQGSHSALGKTRQPVLHRFDRAPAPPCDASHIVAERRGFDHLQPLAHAPGQIRAV
jgi:hypothetical protein